jgi:hypothetical protein
MKIILIGGPQNQKVLEINPELKSISLWDNPHEPIRLIFDPNEPVGHLSQSVYKKKHRLLLTVIPPIST